MDLVLHSSAWFLWFLPVPRLSLSSLLPSSITAFRIPLLAPTPVLAHLNSFLFYAWVLFPHVCICTTCVQVPVEPEECLWSSRADFVCEPPCKYWEPEPSARAGSSLTYPQSYLPSPHIASLTQKNLSFKLKASQSWMLFAFLSFQRLNTLQALILLWNLSFSLKLKLIF